MKVRVWYLVYRHEDSEPGVSISETKEGLAEILRTDLQNEADDERLDWSEEELGRLPSMEFNELLEAWRNHFEYATIDWWHQDLDFVKMEVVKDEAA